MTFVSELRPESNCKWVFLFSFFPFFFRMDDYSILSFYFYLFLFFYPEHALEYLSALADICSDLFSFF